VSTVFSLIRRLIPPRARPGLRRLIGRPLPPAETVAPELSVVIPVYNVAAYLRECLDSALRQSLQNLEVIAVDDASTDGSLDILREYEQRDARVRVVQQLSNSGQGIARNLGTELARGEFLTFLDADDTVPPRAYRYMVHSLKKSGSDFSVGSARRFSNGKYRPTGWADNVHGSDRIGTTIDAFPAAMQDIIACNRMFRTDFWREKVGEFQGHIAYEDHVPMLTAYVRATRFDVLSRITYNWRVREDLTSTGQQKHRLDNLFDRILVKEQAHELLRDEASVTVYDAWVARTLDVDFPAFISSAFSGGEMYRNVLSATYETFFSRASEAALRQVTCYQKLRGWLCAESRWDHLEGAGDHFRDSSVLPPTSVLDGRIVADFPEGAAFLENVPASIRELGTHETRFKAALMHVHWRGTVLELTGWALIRGLSTSTGPPRTEAFLVDRETGERITLDVVPREIPEATIWASDVNAAYDAAGITMSIDTAALVATATRPRFWSLYVRVEDRGIAREGYVHAWVNGSAANSVRARPALFDGAPGLVRPFFDGSHGFSVAVGPSDIFADRLEVEPGTKRASGVIRIAGQGLGEPTAVRARAKNQPAMVGRLRQIEANTYEIEFDAPGGQGSAATSRLDWNVKVLFAGEGGETAVPVRAPEELPCGEAESEIGIAWTTNRSGELALTGGGPELEVTEFASRADCFELVVRHSGIQPKDLDTMALVAGYVELPLLDRTDRDRGTSVMRFDRYHASFGGPRLPAPTGKYTLVANPGNLPLVASCADSLAETFPVRHHESELSLKLTIRGNNKFLLNLQPPLKASEQGRTAQMALRRAYATGDVAPKESVLFQCYRGEFATDSQLALDAGLRVARPDLARYWGVMDLSTELPEGSLPIVIGTQEWYDVLAASRYLCNNIDFDGFFRKRPHQRYLQTFHGYPFKSMGTSFWAGKGFAPDRIARECERRNAEWDGILVPTEECAEFYRKEYSYRGDVLVTGYPRADFVVNADRAEVRQHVLNRLGVPEDKTLVLYAPTYRDELTTRTYAAKRFDELDLGELTEGLGPEVVILVRGHNNNQREPDRVLSVPNVVDVTDYPEINELTVAADAAILDYSSLRFEWALTGRPAVFFVPDVDSYFARRPPLFDYAGTAPGPWLTTTAEVVDSLRNLDEVASKYAGEIAEFNARFNALHDGKATERVIKSFFS